MIRRTHRLSGLGIALAVLGVAAVAQATSALYVTDVQQAELSTAVVVATIGEATVKPHPEWNRPMTHTTLRIDEVLHGAAPAELTIEQYGGTLNDQTHYLPGDATFEQGEKCVLFLRQVDGGWYLTALQQSKYKIVSHPRLGTLLERKLDGGIWVRNDAGRLVEYSEPPSKPIRTLEEFRALMKTVKAPAAEAK